MKVLNGQVFGITGNDSVAAARAKVLEVSHGLRGTGAGERELAVLASFLGLDSGGEDELLSSLSPQERRNVFFELVRSARRR